MAGAGGVNMEQFEAYFRRADLDHDGRIDEAEAVPFFQGSNLPQQVIDQIWMHADENQTGFLNHPAFFNALKLVTLAQSQQELTKDMVKAALHGPAYAKIPPPLINLAAIHAPQPNMAAATPSPPMRAPALPSAKLDPFETLQSPLVNPSTGAQAPQGPSFQIPTTFTSSPSSSGVSASIGSSTPEQSQSSWPELTRESVQHYAKVFMEVDTDRDGKITGIQTRNLFFSWRLLPREVLKQVWDLSDQDRDSMLSLREFCIALYLMERCLEGQKLPPMVPSSVMLGEALLFLEGPPIVHGSVGSSPTTGFNQQQGLPVAQPITPAGLRPPMQLTVSQADELTQLNQQNSRDPAVGNSYLLSNEEDNSLDTKGPRATKTSEKVNNEKVLLDSGEKLEFYNTKVHELVSYKSRCDTLLNEITERAKVDKTEAELLEKKYQEKYKQVAESHSKPTIEEASFGDIQICADRILSDTEELLKDLTDPCKNHAVEMKSSALVELPQGWKPVLNADSTSGKPFSNSDIIFETYSIHSADGSKSMQGSHVRETTYVSPSEEFSENHFTRGSAGGGETLRSFDEPTWGNNDDMDSGASSERTDSPHKNSPFAFEDSVPRTPLSMDGNSPSTHSIESVDAFFDSFSRFDSFSS